MKSKSTESKISSVKKQKESQSYDFLNHSNKKPFDFAGLYKTAAETSEILKKGQSNETNNNENTKNDKMPVERERSPSKKFKKRKKELIEVSQNNIDSSSLNSNTGAHAHSKANPNSTTSVQNGNVKSIMKNPSIIDQSVDNSRSIKSSGKPKKRNKSVSFMLDDNEEVVKKKTKSNDTIKTNKNVEDAIKTVKDKKKPNKKFKKCQQSEKENTATNINKQGMDIDSPATTTQEPKSTKNKLTNVTESSAPPTSTDEVQTQEKRKKFKKVKKHKSEINPETIEIESNKNLATPASANKKFKHKKLKKPAAVDNEEDNGEPRRKSRKTDSKPDIVEDLENLSIGDNAHTLTNMLDELTVVDKDKKKKIKGKHNKKSKPKEANNEQSEKSEVKEKEKVKWSKRKWNKDKKGAVDDNDLANIVVVENLPLSIMLNYKKILTDHFVKYGLIKTIGIAEVYPTEECKPVFTTTVHFYSDGAATQALELNNTELEGSRIRVKHPLPRTATTIVVRSYAELTDQNISSAFLGAGKIRSIKHLVKGKKAIATAFVEFDGPEAVQCALTKMADTKIGGKKIHVAKFEPRSKKKKAKGQKNDGDSAVDADSENSID